MLVHVANWYDCDRISATAGEDMPLGCLVSLEPDGLGGRKLMKVDNANDLVEGAYGVAMKVSTDPLAVSSSTAPTFTGDRTVSIKQGDQIIMVGDDAIMDYDVSLLDASLDPARSGTLPAVKDRLGIKAAKWCTLAASGAIATPMVGRVIEVYGTRVRIEITDPTV